MPPTVYPAATHFSQASGTRVLDRFTIRRGLGIGGFGEVYFAISDAGKEVALKRVQRHLEVELRGVSHCLNLKHPNLVSLHDVCKDRNETWWVVMEYVAGPSLRDVLDERPAGLDADEAIRWLTAAATGVAHLHQQGLVHRDLKPGNLFDDFGIVKVGDYGLSKIISETRRGGQTESVGTFHYMAPEISRGEYGREIDLYALGVILYEMLTGRLPFDGQTSHEIIMKHLTALPDLDPIAPPLRDVVEIALRKDPDQRWSSATAMIQAIEQRASGSAPKGTATENPNAGAPAAETPNAEIPAAEIPVRLVPPEEPLAQAVAIGWRHLTQWWRDIQLSPLVRMVLIALVALVLLRNLRWMLPVLTTLGLVYVPYYVLRQLRLGGLFGASEATPRGGRQAHPGRSDEAGRPIPQARFVDSAARSPGAIPRPPGFNQRIPGRISRAQWRRLKRDELASKPISARLAELSGSWLAAALTIAFCGLAAGVVGLRQDELSALRVAPFVSVMVTALAATVMLLGLGKLWESSDGEPLNRRLVLAGVGGLVGTTAFAMASFLMLPLDQGLGRTIDVTDLPRAFYARDGSALPAAFVVHFAALMALFRWWKLTDPLRKQRLALWPVVVAVVFDWLIHQCVPVPQPAGMMVVGTTAIAVQIAAHWDRSANSPPRLSKRQGGVS